MKNYKWASLLLACLFILSMTACSGSSGGNQAAGTATAAVASSAESAEGSSVESSEPASQEASAAPEATKETFPDKYATLKNPNIKMVFWESMDAYQKLKKDNPTAYESVLEGVPDFEKKYGGKVEIIAVDWGKMQEKTTAMQNAGDAPDLMMVSDQTFHNVASKGVVMPIDQYVDDKDYAFWKVGRDLFTWKGSTYAVPIKPYFMYILYNKTMFEENGLKTPKEYFMEGNWTFDTFAEVGKALTRDTDGDGKINTWGFSSWQDFIPALFLCNGGSMLNITTDKMSSGLKQPQTLEAMKYISDWMKQPGGFMNFSIDMYQEFDNGRLAMIRSKEYPAPEEPFEVDMIPYPVGPSNAEKSVYIYPQGWAVPTGAKNPEGAVAFIYQSNLTMKERGEQLELQRFGQENYDMINSPDLKVNYCYDKGLSDIWNIIGSICNYMTDQMPPATIAEKMDPVINASIEKSYGKQQ